jgi:hypothetical protein
MATLTATAVVAAPTSAKIARGPETITRVFDYVKATSLSAGDVVLMDAFAQIPHGATLVQCRLSGQTKDGTIIIAPHVDVGTTRTVLGSLTLSAAGRIGDVLYSSAQDSAHLPFTISVSDDASIRYARVGFVVGTTASHTGSTSLSIIITYTQDR